jgi:hypothetical protein
MFEPDEEIDIEKVQDEIERIDIEILKVNQELNEYLKKARIQGLMNFPLIIENDNLKTLQEIMK